MNSGWRNETGSMHQNGADTKLRLRKNCGESLNTSRSRHPELVSGSVSIIAVPLLRQMLKQVQHDDIKERGSRIKTQRHPELVFRVCRLEPTFPNSIEMPKQVRHD